MRIVCEFCGRTLDRSNSLKKHLTTKICKTAQTLTLSIKNVNDSKLVDKETIESLREQIQTLTIENIKLKEELYKFKIKSTVEEAKLEITKERADRLEQHILTENSKPRTSNNITMNMAPYCSQDEIKEICKRYTVEHFNGGPEATYKFLLENCFRDEDGRPRVKCTDSSRRVFKGVKKSGGSFVDVGGQTIAKDVGRPMKNAVRDAANQIQDETDEVWCQKTTSHYRALEPTRLSKRLARDLVEDTV